MKRRNEENVYKGTTKKGILKCIRDILCLNIILFVAVQCTIFIFENVLAWKEYMKIAIPVAVFYCIFLILFFLFCVCHFMWNQRKIK